MKHIILFAAVSLLLVIKSHANRLIIGGVVPDRGYVVEYLENGAGRFQTLQGTELKIYVTTVPKQARMPQSVGTQNWKKLSPKQTISTSSLIRVEAP